MQIGLFVGLCFYAVLMPSEASLCKKDTDCGTGECCYIEPPFLIASKRRQLDLAPPLPPSHDGTGICQTMKALGDKCDGYAVSMSHCTCPPGAGCQWVPDPTTKTHRRDMSRRGPMLPHNEPGSYRCATI